MATGAGEDWCRMDRQRSRRTLREPSRTIEVCREAEVIVVGGGPAGVAAAVASARSGADTVLIERYGHLGGLATGGLVILIMPMSDIDGQQQISGLCQEFIDRLAVADAAVYPSREELGSSEKELVTHWLSRGCRFFAQEGRVTLNVLFDPEMLKCVLNDMVSDAGIKLLLHSWGARCLADKGGMRGVLFESKSGRQAILGKVVVDATGDGDMFASAGAEFDTRMDPTVRSSMLALVFRVAGVDFGSLGRFRETRANEYDALMKEVERLGGFPLYIRTWREDTVWFNNFLPGLDGLNVDDLTWVEVNARKRMLLTHDFFKKNVPGFEGSYIVDTASQVGVRATRRLVGEYVVTERDIQSGALHEDTIAVAPVRQWAPHVKPPLAYIPYGSLLPRTLENLLVAGRCLSSDQFANNLLSPIQCCVAMGQAAGTAAALAVRERVTPRQIERKVLQQILRDQGVPLPATPS